MRQLAAILITGIGFWVLSPSNGGLWNNDGFANFNDCQAVRAWVASVQPTPTTPPSAGQLVVSPSCYYSESATTAGASENVQLGPARKPTSLP
jgi:hypothetical protein